MEFDDGNRIYSGHLDDDKRIYPGRLIEQFLNSRPTLPEWSHATYKDWIQDILYKMVFSGDVFSSKRANCGTSGWQVDLFTDMAVLIQPAIVIKWRFCEYEKKSIPVKFDDELAKEVWQQIIAYIFTD